MTLFKLALTKMWETLMTEKFIIWAVFLLLDIGAKSTKTKIDNIVVAKAKELFGI